MKNRKDRNIKSQPKQTFSIKTNTPIVKSLLDAMVDDKEYSSIVGITLQKDKNLVEDVFAGLKEISDLRQRPCLMYVGNVAGGSTDAGVIAKDDLPFMEMVQSVPAAHRRVDVFLATNGGSGSQIARFVNMLRSRFDGVDFLLPSFCMSAGTLFALSGDRIWMTPQACLGPIDPQVPNQSGRIVPAQALLLLVDKLQKDGQAEISAGRPVPWTAIRMIDTMDKKDYADAISASAYSKNLAVQFLTNYKFKEWSIRQSSMQPVTSEYRLLRANEVADALASHEKWKSHGHTISREILWNEIKLQIDHPDHAMERVMRRTWAICYWLFDKLQIQKIIASSFSSAYLTYNVQQPQGVKP